MDRGLLISPARKAGFVVTGNGRPGVMYEILFAGSLSDGLKYVEEELDCIHQLDGGADGYILAA